MAQQTAVEWLQNELLRLEMLDGYGMFQIFEQAKQIEKQQIEVAYSNGSNDRLKNRINGQYYNETYAK